MNKPALAPVTHPTTSSKSLSACEQAQENTQKVAAWIVTNPWIDKAKVDLIIPGMSYVAFEPHCKAIVVMNVGASNWKASSEGVEKMIDGIRVIIRREQITFTGEIPEAEMLKGVE